MSKNKLSKILKKLNLSIDNEELDKAVFLIGGWFERLRDKVKYKW